MKKWADAEESIRHVIDNSDLHMTEHIPYEGDQRSESKTDIEKNKLFDKIKAILTR